MIHSFFIIAYYSMYENTEIYLTISVDDVGLFLVFAIIYNATKNILIHISQEIYESIFLRHEISGSSV